MGHLYFFNLNHLITTYQARVFVETGTGFGFGVYHATQFPFDRIFSCDVLTAEINRLKDAFDPRVQLFNGASPEVLRQLLPQIHSPIVFWLDAHYPGAHHSTAGYAAAADERVRLPLHSELDVIKQLRPQGKDVILIDDLRIYERDNFDEGNMADLGMADVASTEDPSFLYTTFADTHEAKRFTAHTGYLALLPKLPTPNPVSPPT